MCWRLAAGRKKSCPEKWPEAYHHWCPACRQAYDRHCDERAQEAAWQDRMDALGSVSVPEEGPEPPCPLESHQAEAFAAWLALGDRPAWSLEQVVWPSPN